jgi:hypothetical protein
MLIHLSNDCHTYIFKAYLYLYLFTMLTASAVHGDRIKCQLTTTKATTTTKTTTKERRKYL